MSRSYKKYPCWGDDSCNGIHSGVHYYKNYANRIVRKLRNWNTPSGGAYRRVFCSWTIRDHQRVMYTKQEVRDEIDEAKQELAGELPAHQNWWRADPLTENSPWFARLRKRTLMYHYYSK